MALTREALFSMLILLIGKYEKNLLLNRWTDVNAAAIISIPVIKNQSGRFVSPLIFPSEENQLIPRLALLFEEPCPLASGWHPHQPA